MSYPQQPRVLFATLTECTSAAGKPYLRGYVGASNLVAFPGPVDEQGRPTWNLYLSARPPKQDAQEARPAPERPRSASRAIEAPAPRAAPVRREGSGSRQEQAAREVLARYGLHDDPSDPVPF